MKAGEVCAVTGLSKTYPGEGIGCESESFLPVLEPVLTYQIRIPQDCDVHKMLQNLKQLEEEEPLLHIVWNERLGEIHAQLMGEVQTEILKSMIAERFGVRVEFGAGNIVYKETIRNTVEGVGHFEPLRITRKSICCWSRENPEAECIFCPIAVKMCWIKTGSV